MSQPIKILTFAGSARSESFNKKLLPVAAAGIREAGADATIIDLRDFPLPLFDQDLEAKEGIPDHAKTLKRLFLEHQGLVIASPEYNSAFTPLLKNTLDWVSRSETKDEQSLSAYRNKVAGIVSASPGGLGGLRGLVMLRMLLSNLGVLVIPKQHALRSASKAFDNEGILIDEGQAKSVKAIGREVVRVASALRESD
ncbi:MAG: NAD(P)H-dependent oxidoreductase [Pseudomonadota bacterium]